MSANVPAKLVAGDSWSWTSSFRDNPAPTWALTFYFQNASASFQVDAAASGNDHLASKAAVDTVGLSAGRYRWRARAVNGSQTMTLEEGWVVVDPNAAASAVDLRSSARIMLDAVEATLLGRATDGQLSMMIGHRSISRIPIPDLMQLRDRLREEVRIEEQGSKAGLGRNLRTRFGRA